MPREVRLATSLSTFTHRVACPADLVYPGIEEHLGNQPLPKRQTCALGFNCLLGNQMHGALRGCRGRRLRGSVALALVHVRKAEIPENPNDLPGEMREGLQPVATASIPCPNHSVHIVCSSQAAPQPTYLSRGYPVDSIQDPYSPKE